MSHERGSDRPAAPGWLEAAASAIGHEVGNSLLALSFLLAELRSGPGGDARNGRLDDAEATLERASGAIALLGRLCALPNPDERLDLREVIEAAAPLLRAVARRALAIALPGAPVFVRAARASAERALFELAFLTAGSSEGARARLALEPARGGETRIRLALESPVALDASALARTHALADACGGRVSVADVAHAARCIELVLPTRE